jgi:hypothetical protein
MFGKPPLLAPPPVESYQNFCRNRAHLGTSFAFLLSSEKNDMSEANAKPRSSGPKQVRSDLKDVTPGKVGAAFPHDLEQTPPSRKDRHRAEASSRSDHVPHAVPRGDREPRGGRDRTERRHRST